MYFWASGALSSFLDNAPTYLVFFNTRAVIAGADDDAGLELAAISAGSGSCATPTSAMPEPV